ncbi:hypothetical protein PCIT_b0294 [Pseudoalteromonas citrea]|uniref:PKD/Chitinase domain-containing protein n=3 Tax=Pseudoalteromonas citrea TaxID=43655 RepID=A0AAD4AEC8_9GAMM|nr:hypothetical protein [Pseudoalteromonas citrea]KAF7764323.1 hypothetical protein PCIT_b0294 [Pseudoalteromonas citrea]
MYNLKKPFQFSFITVTLVALLSACGGSSSTDTSVKKIENRQPNVVISGVTEIESGAEVYMTSSATDSDGTVASYQWSQKSGYAVTIRDKNQANASFTAPVLDADTTLEFELLVTDDKGATAKDTLNVKVKRAEVENQLPNVVITTVTEIESGSEVYMTSSATDPDGTIASYQWSQKSGYGVTIRDKNQANASFTAPVLDADTTLEFELLVSDNQGGEAKDIVSIKVKSAVQASNHYDSCNAQLAPNVLNIYNDTLNFSSLSALKKWFCSASEINNSNLTKQVISVLSAESNEQDIELWKTTHCTEHDKGFGDSMSANLLLEVADDDAIAGWSNCITQEQMLSCYTLEQESPNSYGLNLNYGLKHGSSRLINVDIVTTNLIAIGTIPDTLASAGKAILFKKDDASNDAHFELSGTLDNENVSCSYTVKNAYPFGAELCELQRLSALEQGKISQRDYTELKYRNMIPDFNHRDGSFGSYRLCE